MKRDMIKTAEQIKGKVPAQYDMTVLEFQQLHEMLQKDEFKALSMAFEYGFVLGTRAERANRYNLSV